MSARAEDFAPALLRIQANPPAPLAGAVLKGLLAMFAALLLWAAFGRLDIVAVAEGKLVPQSYVKILQPAEQGVVKEILVKEGEAVREGQVLARMDAVMTTADVKALANEAHTKRLALKRIDAQLSGAPFRREPADPAALFEQTQAQYRANLAAYENALSQERSLLDKARHDLAAAEAVRSKLLQVLPHYREQEAAFEKLRQDGFAGRLMATDKARERIEKEQDLKSQEFVIHAARSTIEQGEGKIAQIGADYRRALQAERVDTALQLEKARQELAKHEHRQGLLELKAPQAGTVKDLATHTPGTVVAPGTILMTLVPANELLRAEVWVSNQDVGFVRKGQDVKVKLAAFPFQKYGMLDATIAQVSADATEAPTPNTRTSALSGREQPTGALAFRALVDLKTQALETEGAKYSLAPGMQVVAEIKLGERTLLEYLLSPVRKVAHEAARER
jgi:HlyD family secretion protein